MKTITFYSYKGGVGRTLALANIAKRLSEFRKKVCLIDFDLEAPGLHHKFREYIDNKYINKGLVDYINYFSANKTPPESISDYVTTINFRNSKFKNIDFIAAGNVNSGKYWKTLSSIDWINLFYKKDSQGVALFVDLKERIKKELKPDYLLIDSRTGISEISGITMSLMADEIVLLTVKNDENIQGLKQIINTLCQPENTLLGKLPKLNYVLCRIPYYLKPFEKDFEIRAINEVERNLRSFIKKNNLPVIFEKLFIIHSDPSLEIEDKLLMGYQYETEEDNSQISRRRIKIKTPIASDYLDLFEELTKDKLTKKEKKIFNNIKKAEFYIERARNYENDENKLKLLKDALELNPESDEAYSLLADFYYIKGEYKNALDNINKAIALNKDSIKYLCGKGRVYFMLNDNEEAKAIYDYVLKRDNNNYLANLGLGSIYYKLKKYRKSLDYYLKIVELNPDYYGGYNSVGNVYRILKDYDNAFKYIFKALELNPKDPFSTGTLAEIYAQLKNDNEFYKNFELSLAFDMSPKILKRILKEESVYNAYLKETRFLNILKKYNIDLDISE